MARVTNSPASRKRRKKVLKYAKGYFGNKSKLYRYAKEAVQHAWQYAYIDRKVLSDLAIRDEVAFNALVKKAQDALKTKASSAKKTATAKA